MKNLKQVTIIQNALTTERNKLMRELDKISAYIQKKQESLQKVIGYLKEYSEGIHLNASRCVPILHKNLDSFTKKMNNLINKEEKEINGLVNIRTDKLKQIEILNNKVNVMIKFARNIRNEQQIYRDNLEQNSIDEMSINKRTRGSYE